MGSAVQTQGSKGARGALLVCAALLTLGLAAAPADAKKNKKAGAVSTVSQSQTVPPELDGTAIATCPEGTTVVSGGFAAGPLDAEFLEGMVVRESRMEGNGWQVSAANISDVTPGTVIAYAYCRKKTKPLVAVSASVFNCFCTPKIEAVATCPTGLKPASGGFSGPLTYNDGGAIPQMSDRFGAFAWKYLALDQGFEPSLVTAYAYCVAKSRLQTTGIRVIEGINAGGTAYAQQCKRRGLKMLGGGFTAQSADFAFGNSLQVVTASVREGGRWATTANEAIFGPGTLESSGYCG